MEVLGDIIRFTWTLVVIVIDLAVMIVRGIWGLLRLITGFAINQVLLYRARRQRVRRETLMQPTFRVPPGGLKR